MSWHRPPFVVIVIGWLPASANATKRPPPFRARPSAKTAATRADQHTLNGRDRAVKGLLTIFRHSAQAHLNPTRCARFELEPRLPGTAGALLLLGQRKGRTVARCGPLIAIDPLLVRLHNQLIVSAIAVAWGYFAALLFARAKSVPSSLRGAGPQLLPWRDYALLGGNCKLIVHRPSRNWRVCSE